MKLGYTLVQFLKVERQRPGRQTEEDEAAVGHDVLHYLKRSQALLGPEQKGTDG